MWVCCCWLTGLPPHKVIPGLCSCLGAELTHVLGRRQIPASRRGTGMQRRYMTAQAGRQVAALTCCRRPMRVSVLQELLALKPWVTVILASAPLATFAEVKSFESWVDAVPDAHIREWKAQPGNFQLMTKQGGEWAGLKEAVLCRIQAGPGTRQLADRFQAAAGYAQRSDALVKLVLCASP